MTPRSRNNRSSSPEGTDVADHSGTSTTRPDRHQSGDRLWRCPRCGHETWQPSLVVELIHPCPTARRTTTALRPVETPDA